MEYKCSSSFINVGQIPSWLDSRASHKTRQKTQLKLSLTLASSLSFMDFPSSLTGFTWEHLLNKPLKYVL